MGGYGILLIKTPGFCTTQPVAPLLHLSRQIRPSVQYNMVNLLIFYHVDLVQFGFQRKDATKTPIEFHFKHRKNGSLNFLRLFSR